MAQRVFKRKLYDKLLQWKRERNGTTALLIKGARRVGKSTLAKMFAQNEYDSFILIDFAECSNEVRGLFDDISNLDAIFFQLQFLYDVQLYERRSVIIFDEVQFCPKARQAIKKLVNDHRYDYIETGSLLSIKKNIENIRIPSEETSVTLFPLDYEEFRWSLGDELTVPMLKDAFDSHRSLSDVVVRKMLLDYRLYMLVGGMPQAVNAYIDTNNLGFVDSVKRDIIDLYADDFRKIDATGNATRLFYSIPAQLYGNASRYKTSAVIEGARADRVLEIIQDMEDSGVVLVSRHANDPSVGLALHQDIKRFKLFLNDTGLFITIAFRDKSYTENLIYQKLLTDKLSADLGYVFENMVAQTLKTNGYELYYHTWPTDNGKHNYETDFLISKGDKLCPIEVKSSNYNTHSSLDAFCSKYSSRVAERYLIYTKDFRKDGQIMLLPVFMSQFL